MPVWKPALDRAAGPLYRAIVESLADDIAAGRLAEGERLPPQRALAEALGIDFTTVTRAYAEARRQGLVEASVGRGTFVRRRARGPAASRTDLAMNIPPRPADPRLAARLWRGMAELGEERGLDLLLRYQAPGGTAEDRAAGAGFLAPRLAGAGTDRVLVAPGAQAALAAITLEIAGRGDVVLAEGLTYPGYRALCARLGVSLVAVASDEAGMLPDDLDAMAARHRPKAVYLNPTLANPTTITLPSERRVALVAVARRHGLTIIEDDAYGALPYAPPPSLATLAPELTYHVAGLAKCLSPALRIAYVAAPDAAAADRLAAMLRATVAMASPLSAALATRWLGDGTAADMLAAIRAETATRQAIAAARLPSDGLRSDRAAFHAWLTLPLGWSRSAFLARLDGLPIGLVASDAFALGAAPEAIRIGFGTGADRDEFASAIDRIAALTRLAPALDDLVV